MSGSNPANATETDFETDNIINNGTNNVTTNVVNNEDIPQLLDFMGGSHRSYPDDDDDDDDDESYVGPIEYPIVYA
ncbi:hypothetical protein Tco_0085336 [Tanacetum coccineum]